MTGGAGGRTTGDAKRKSAPGVVAAAVEESRAGAGRTHCAGYACCMAYADVLVMSGIPTHSHCILAHFSTHEHTLLTHAYTL
jgi:hypothetical protein